MSGYGAKIRLSAGFLLLLVPLSLLVAFFAAVNYSAYPIPNLRPLQIAFDLGMLLQVAGIVAAWRLAARYLLAGRRAMRDVHPVWFVLLALGATVGLLGAFVAVEQVLFRRIAPDYVGLALFTPAAALVFFCVQFRSRA